MLKENIVSALIQLNDVFGRITLKNTAENEEVYEILFYDGELFRKAVEDVYECVGDTIPLNKSISENLKTLFEMASEKKDTQSGKIKFDVIIKNCKG